MDFLNHPETTRIIWDGLREDVGDGDHTSIATLPVGTRASARCLVKDTGVLAGVALAERIFKTVDPALELDIQLQDGAWVKAGDEPFYVRGRARSILTAERLVLNIMQRMSGIATETRRVVDRLAGTDCRVLDTRKTTPLVRHLEKWAVSIAGGVNHRFGLYDLILIKDNHIDVAGGITEALRAAITYRDAHKPSLGIIIETRTFEDVKRVVELGGADRILLDNMSPAQIREVVDWVDGRISLEASGGINPDTAYDYAKTGVNFISMGHLTHSYRSLDISLKVMMDRS